MDQAPLKLEVGEEVLIQTSMMEILWRIRKNEYEK